MKSLIILNPSAARGKAIKLKDEIESELKKNEIDYHLYISKSAQHITDIIKDNLNRDYLNFIGAGGDGTIHYIANALAGTGKNLGYIPTGSGNDIAKNLGIPLNIKECCKIIKKAKTKKIDVGLINNRYYYLCIAGSGFDSEVNRLANDSKFPIGGPAKYTYAVYKTLITFKPKNFSIEYDNKTRELDIMMMVASNMPAYGGGMKITPNSDPTDGKFDICIIKKMSKIHFIKTFPKVFKGKHTDDPFVEIFKTASLKIDCKHKFSVFADGEYICKLPATFKLIPKMLNFIVP